MNLHDLIAHSIKRGYECVFTDWGDVWISRDVIELTGIRHAYAFMLWNNDHDMFVADENGKVTRLNRMTDMFRMGYKITHIKSSNGNFPNN